jgi:AcrR family transcriptional regulator
MKACPENSTEQKIVAAAVPLFASKGFDAVSVKELAEAAGVNIALISYYFGGKEKLYMHILSHIIEMLDQLLCELEASTKDPVERLRLFLTSAAKGHESNPYIGQLLNTEKLRPTAGAHEILHKGGLKIHMFMTRCIREAIGSGRFRADIHDDYAALAVNAMLHVFFFWQCHCEFLPVAPEGADGYMTQMFDIFLHGVGAPVQKNE